jgi:hypothetical protein
MTREGLENKVVVTEAGQVTVGETVIKLNILPGLFLK